MEYIRPQQAEVRQEQDVSDVFRAQLNDFAYTDKANKHSTLSIEILKRQEAPGTAPGTAEAARLFNDALTSRIERLPAEEKDAFPSLVTATAASIDTLLAARDPVRSMVKNNNVRGAEQQQLGVIKQSDQIPAKALLLGVRAVKDALNETDDEDVRARLKEKQTALQQTLALPFTERFRLAAMQLSQRKLEDAEKTLEEALKVKLPPHVLENESIRNLIGYALAERRHLETTRSIPKFTRERFSSVAGSDGYMSQEELSSALAKSQFNELEKRIIAFMIKEYDKLIDMKNDGFFRNAKGISKRDLEQYWESTRPGEFR
ncbi:MAG TPA: hypothetical protein V6D17_12780 [Candidatus Obscuribacterales bacterium]